MVRRRSGKKSGKDYVQSKQLTPAVITPFVSYVFILGINNIHR